MLSERLVKELNKQLNYELYSAYVYLGMAAACEDLDFPGFAHWLKTQFDEEQQHAMKIYTFLNDKEAKVELETIPKVSTTYNSLEDIFKDVLSHEQGVTKRIYNLLDIAMEEREHSTISMLQVLVDEQVEEEATAKMILKKIERSRNYHPALLMLDNESASRGPANFQ